MRTTTVVVIDDHPLFRQGVIDSLSLIDYLKFVGQEADGKLGMQMIRQLQPDIAVVDVNLPGINGHQLTRSVIAEKLPTRVILLTAYHDLQQKVHAMVSGAAAYCTKDIPPEELLQIIQQVAEGFFVLDAKVYNANQLADWLEGQSGEESGSSGPTDEPRLPLSARESQVLKFITQGYSNKEIAVALHISHQTVKNHVTSILRKIKVEDRTQAALFALRHGWVRLHQEEELPEE